MKFVLLLGLFFSMSSFASYNSIYLNVSKKDLDNYKIRPESYQFTESEIKINDRKEIVKKLATRGQTSINAPRRSFSLKLENKVNFFDAMDGVVEYFETKDFKLISMWEDNGYVTAQLGYAFFRNFGLYKTHTTYAEVFLNNVSQGLYLVVDSPENFAKKNLLAPCFIRRGYGKKYEIEFPKKEEVQKYNQCEQTYQEILSPQDKLKGDELYNYLNARLNMKSYYLWLIINSLLESGDYSDEVFLYAVEDKNAANGIRFEIMAWDPDDIFQKPHFSLANFLRKDKLERSLLMSLEAKIDRLIDGDKILEKRLAGEMIEFLNQKISKSLIETILDTIKQKIEPYLDNPSVTEMSKLDRLDKKIKKTGYTREYIYTLIEGYKSRILARKQFLLERAKNI